MVPDCRAAPDHVAMSSAESSKAQRVAADEHESRRTNLVLSTLGKDVDVLHKVLCMCIPAEHHPRVRLTCRVFNDVVPWGKPEALASFISRVTNLRRATRPRKMAHLLKEKLEDVSSRYWIEPEAFALMHYAAEAHVVQSFLVQRILHEEYVPEADEEVEPEELNEYGEYIGENGTTLFGAAQLTRRPSIADRIPGLAGKRQLTGHLQKIRGRPVVVAVVPERSRGRQWWMPPAIVYQGAMDSECTTAEGFFPARVEEHPYLHNSGDGTDDPDYVDTTASDETAKAEALHAQIATSRPPQEAPDLATLGIGELKRLKRLDRATVQEQMHFWRVAREDGIAEESGDESDDESDDEQNGEEGVDADADEAEGTAVAEAVPLAGGEDVHDDDESDENSKDDEATVLTVLDQQALRDRAHGATADLRAAAYRVIRAAMSRDAAAEALDIGSRSHQARPIRRRDRFVSMARAGIVGMDLLFDEEEADADEAHVEEVVGYSDSSESEDPDAGEVDNTFPVDPDLSQYKMTIPHPPSCTCTSCFRTKRFCTVLRDSIGGIGRSAICRMAAHAGIKFGEQVTDLAAPIFEEMRRSMATYLDCLARDAIAYTNSAGVARACLEGSPMPGERAHFDRVMLMDVVFALKQSQLHTMMHAFDASALA